MSGHHRALVAEACGTFWFVFVAAGAMVTDHMTNGAVGLVGVAVATGLTLAVATSCFGAISGAHFNPAATVALAIARKHPWDRVPTYIGAQLVGALVAGLLLRVLPFDHAPAAIEAAALGTPAVARGMHWFAAMLVEALLTLFLLWAMFGTAVSPNASRVAGFGIGLTVTGLILFAGPLTGAAMNPARWFGPALAAGRIDSFVWVIGPLLGAALAAISYLYIFGHPSERRSIDLPRGLTPRPTGDRTEPAREHRPTELEQRPAERAQPSPERAPEPRRTPEPPPDRTERL